MTCEHCEQLQLKLDAAVADAERWQYMEAHREVALITAFFGNGCINKTIADMRAAIDTARSAARKEGV